VVEAARGVDQIARLAEGLGGARELARLLVGQRGVGVLLRVLVELAYLEPLAPGGEQLEEEVALPGLEEDLAGRLERQRLGRLARLDEVAGPERRAEDALGVPGLEPRLERALPVLVLLVGLGRLERALLPAVERRDLLPLAALLQGLERRGGAPDRRTACRRGPRR
jgi:hypothetical protein